MQKHCATSLLRGFRPSSRGPELRHFAFKMMRSILWLHFIVPCSLFVACQSSHVLSSTSAVWPDNGNRSTRPNLRSFASASCSIRTWKRCPNGFGFRSDGYYSDCCPSVSDYYCPSEYPNCVENSEGSSVRHCCSAGFSTYCPALDVCCPSSKPICGISECEAGECSCGLGAYSTTCIAQPCGDECTSCCDYYAPWGAGPGTCVPRVGSPGGTEGVATVFATTLCNSPTVNPSTAPTRTPTQRPTRIPSRAPSVAQTQAPFATPTQAPNAAPTPTPTLEGHINSAETTDQPTSTPTQRAKTAFVTGGNKKDSSEATWAIVASIVGFIASLAGIYECMRKCFKKHSVAPPSANPVYQAP